MPIRIAFQSLFFIVVFILGLPLAIFAQQNPDDILGIWWNPEKTTRIQVYKVGENYFGKIVWLKADENPDGSKPRIDLNNEDERLRKRRVMGIVVLEHLVWDEDEYVDGSLYDSHRGKAYSCFVELESKNELSLYAYVFGMPFLNKKMTCFRYRQE